MLNAANCADQAGEMLDAKTYWVLDGNRLSEGRGGELKRGALESPGRLVGLGSVEAK